MFRVSGLLAGLGLNSKDEAAVEDMNMLHVVRTLYSIFEVM